jgi:hypothetical protein
MQAGTIAVIKSTFRWILPFPKKIHGTNSRIWWWPCPLGKLK